MADLRFPPLPPRGKDCLACRHHKLNHGVFCLHPERPNVPVEVVRWVAGCAQFEPLKETQ